MPAAPEEPIRLGVFGGTFDPPHVAHVRVAKDVADALDLDRLLWIPAGVPPHKGTEALSDAGTRLEMVRAATRSDPRFEASDVELRREGPSFTVDTLRGLQKDQGGAELYLLLGADQLRTFAAGWKDPETILALAKLVVMDRGGEGAGVVEANALDARRMVHVPVTRMDLSSTEIRRRVARDEDVSALVPPGVLEVMTRERLYRD